MRTLPDQLCALLLEWWRCVLLQVERRDHGALRRGRENFTILFVHLSAGRQAPQHPLRAFSKRLPATVIFDKSFQMSGQRRYVARLVE